MKQEKWTKIWRFVAAIALALSSFAATMEAVEWFGADVPAEEPVARSVDAGCYRDLGGDKWICQSGGEMEFQTGSTLDIQSGATTGFDAAMDLDSTLNVDGAVTFNSTLDVDGNISSGTGAITMTDAVNITSTLDVDSTLNADGAVTLNSTLDVDGNISSGTGAITMTDAVNITSTLDVDSTIVYGTDSLYPLGYATANYQIVCGTSGTFTETTAVSVSGLTTITYAIVTQITDPASTGAFLTVDAPTTSTLTINSWETDATVGTTGVNAYYCAVGNQ